MKTLTMWSLAASAALAADLTVCPSGCTYATMQAAIDAAAPGDTITLAAGQTLNSTPFTLKRRPGARWITIRSSRWRELPEGQRPLAGDARLATLAFAPAGQPLISLEADPAFSSNCWSSQMNGNTVTFGYLHSPEVRCEARLKNGMLYGSIAPLGTVTLLGVPVPTAGTYAGQANGLRVGLGTNGKLWISHKSDLVPGVHFTCTNCETGKRDTWIHFNFPDDSLALAVIGYDTTGAVTGVGDRRVWLSGPWAGRTDESGLFPGMLATTYTGPAAGVHHYRFVGIHFRYNSTNESYYGQMFFKDTSLDYRYVPHHIEFDRCLFSQPKASRGFWRWLGLYHVDHLAVRNTRFLNTQTRAEGQAILTCGALGPVVLENIEIDGGTEGVLAGGCSARIVAVPQIIMRRSLMRKRPEQRLMMLIVRQASPDVLALTATDGVTRCNSGQCKAAYEDTEYIYGRDSTITIAGGQAAKVYVGVSPAGVLTVGHNSGANVTCTGDFTCLAGVAGRADMPEYAMLYEWTAADGTWGAASDWQLSGSWVLIKNQFELKAGRDVLLQGNLFRTYWASGGQGNPVGFTPRNQNGQDHFIRIDGLGVSRNKIIGAHAGWYGIGYDDMGWNTHSRAWGFSHNILLDINRSRWGDTTRGGQAIAYGNGGILGIGVEHNTVYSDRNGVMQDQAPTALNSIHTHNNLFVWHTGGAYGGSFNAQGLASGFLNVRKADWIPVANYGYIGPTSSYRGNLNLSASTIPATGWNNWVDDPTWNFTRNQRAENMTPASHFTNWTDPGSAATDVRLRETSPYSVHCVSGCDTQLATTTGLDPGADVDWVETLTDGVEEGLPERSRRLALRVQAGSSGAVFSLAASDPATLKVSTHQNMKASNLVANTSVPDLMNGGRQIFAVGGLAANTRYWYTVKMGGGVVKDQFMTAGTSASGVFTIVLRPPSTEVATAEVEYGATPALGSATGAEPCASGCSIKVPWSAGALFYRARYRNEAEQDLFQSAITAIAP
jgi:hypothetical protein